MFALVAAEKASFPSLFFHKGVVSISLPSERGPILDIAIRMVAREVGDFGVLSERYGIPLSMRCILAAVSIGIFRRSPTNPPPLKKRVQRVLRSAHALKGRDR